METAQRPGVGETAPAMTIFRATDGQSYPLTALWREGPAILVFLRHLGCTFCREQVANLRHDLSHFAQHNATIGLITLSKPEKTARFCRDRDLESAPFVCLSDPDREAYHAYGLSRISAQELFTPHVVARGFQAALHGHFVSLPKEDPFQMPGVFIVDTQGVVRYAHRHRDAADNPLNAELIAVLDQINASLTCS